MTRIDPPPKPPAYLDRLNAEQRQAVLHGQGCVAEPLLIIAGAGTGKTNTLVHRLTHQVLQGADPRRILLMTFSRRAAGEMIRRAERIAAEVQGVGATPLTEGLIWAGTFHAIGARLLREYAPLLGLEPDFTIQDRADSADLMNLVRHRLGFSGTEKRFPRKETCLGIYSRVVNAQADLGEVLRRHFPWCADWETELQKIFGAYVEAKQSSAVLDYDDLLLAWATMMQNRQLAEEVGGRFDHVMVDEYQDTNRLQAGILQAMKPDGRGLTVVGDDAQAIYAFRAAEVRNILDFPAQFDPTARIIALEENYRSTPEILTAANAILAEAEEGYGKTLRSERTQGGMPRLVTVCDEATQTQFVSEAILAARETGTLLKQQAILFRTSHHSSSLEVELTRRNIPFVKFGGLKFLEAAHIKDVLACLRFIQNPTDRIAGFRVMQLMPGIGPSTAERLLDVLAIGQSAVDDLASCSVPTRASEHWNGFLALYRDLAGGNAGWPAELDAVLAWYDPHLDRLHEDSHVRRQDVLQLASIAAGYPSRERFLTEITLDPPSATSDLAGPPLQDEDYLILSTIHSAKGQEWRQVFVLNCVDGCIPSDLGTGSKAEIEEERRLFYVAVTRAKDNLSLIQPQRFYTHQQARRSDRHVYAARTRFIPDSALQYFEQVTWPSHPCENRSANRDPKSLQAIDLKSALRAQWR